MNGISALTKEIPEISPAPFPPCENTAKEQSAGEKGTSPEPDHAGILPSDFQPLEVEKRISVVYKLPVLWHFAIIVQMDCDKMVGEMCQPVKNMCTCRYSLPKK